MPSVLPDSGTYQLSIFKLQAGFKEAGIPDGYKYVANDKPDQYDSKTEYTLGSGGNTVSPGVMVTFGVNAQKRHTISIKYGNGSVKNFSVSREYSSDDPSVIIVQDSSPVTGVVNGRTRTGSDRDWYMIANPTVDPKKYIGKTIDHYFNTSEPNTPDVYYLGNIMFSEDNIPGGGPNGKDKGGSNENNNTFNPCYLAGTLIRTPNGDVKVEDLKIGDVVSIYKDGKLEAHPLRWVGKSRVYVRHGINDGKAEYPVRIQQNALADNVPSQDLFVTPEHCMFVEGVFIPARMLVNGSTVAYQNDVTEYDIYHVETEKHSVIWANDALSETYLDTGSRHVFSVFASINASSENLEQYRKTWEKDAAAPLVTRRDVVEPIWKDVAQRAGCVLSAHETTEEPNLRLMIDTGEVLLPYRVSNQHYLFRLPERVANVRILSRTSRPSEVVGPFVDDRRNLGVLIDDLRLFQDDGCSIIETPFQESSLQGWDVIEASHCRWTKGDALLPVGNTSSMRVLSIHVQKAGPYRIEDEASDSSYSEASFLMSA
ncbi:hypothetical protein GS501_08060 [Saccharibacter sp. 17.LH.SD]|uniref:Hint domain-containing protein n=1 Tax=Saccharibacter sp. 17.LH.SD TaxID=2689393 RepID=UPI00136F671F|nr:Hint domain-containing protein [Saccharibacter sp. 17.LH.SD]MXV44992.1 hypothetical protein [Saccharibacter sp. 17.LH.SD]